MKTRLQQQQREHAAALKQKQQQHAAALKQKQQQQQRASAAALRQQQGEHAAALKQQQQQHAAALKQQQRERQDERTALTAELETLRGELAACDTLARLSPEEQLPGLSEEELRQLEDSAREERARRQRLQMQREMRAEMEQAAAELTEQLLCAICMEREKDCTFSCGHRTCMHCSNTLSVCPFCNALITTKTRTY